MKKKDQSGQAVLEYILLLAIVVGITFAANQRFRDSIDQAVVKWGGRLERELRTGAATPSLWNK